MIRKWLANIKLWLILIIKSSGKAAINSTNALTKVQVEDTLINSTEQRKDIDFNWNQNILKEFPDEPLVVHSARFGLRMYDKDGDRAKLSLQDLLQERKTMYLMPDEIDRLIQEDKWIPMNGTTSEQLGETIKKQKEEYYLTKNTITVNPDSDLQEDLSK